jgi:hypothetical protein
VDRRRHRKVRHASFLHSFFLLCHSMHINTECNGHHGFMFKCIAQFVQAVHDVDDAHRDG